MPWKFCPACKQISYSAATHYTSWQCPYCGRELKDEPEYDSLEARALKDKHSTEAETQKPSPSIQ